MAIKKLDDAPASCRTWGFDITHFTPYTQPSATAFKSFLQENKLNLLTTIKRQYSPTFPAKDVFLWHNTDKSVQVVTERNPFLGDPKVGVIVGSAGFMAVKTNTFKQLEKTVKSIYTLTSMIKDQSPCRFDFIGFPKPQEIVSTKTVTLHL